MTEQALADVMVRALRDQEFVALLRDDAGAALAEFDLTESERTAILESLGGGRQAHELEQRPFKASRLI